MSEQAVRLQETTTEMLNEVESLPPELIHWIPGPGVWSIMDILCHVREFLPFWTAETLRIACGTGDQWGRTHADEARLAAVANTASVRLDDVAKDIRREVRHAADALNQLSDADLAAEATSRNPRWGLKPAFFIVDDLLVHHVEKHLGQIRRNIAAYDELASPERSR